MPWPARQDPTFQTGAYVFGYSMPGFAAFGNARTYNQQAIFGIRPFGAEIPGKNLEDEILTFIDGAPVPRKTGKWARTPLMTIVARGGKAKRFIFYKWRNRRCCRRYTQDTSAPKDYLAPWALKLMESSFLWSILTDENKQRLVDDAKRTGQATQGHNYFTKLYIKDDPRWMNYV